MSVGKYLSLEEARKKKLLKRFAAAHPSEGNEREFDRMLGEMIKPAQKKAKRRKLAVKCPGATL